MAYLCEKLSFRQLLAYSEPKRKQRARNVRGPSLKLETGDDSNYYMFNFRGYPSTTGQRHVGYVRFLKPKNPDTPLKDIDCEVDCDCPDFKYRFAWSNKQRGAAKVGPGSYNKAFNRAPRITNPTNQPGLCKHLIAVKDYLGDLVYKMPRSLKAPERLGRLVTLTNRSVINPPKGGEAEPVITKPAPFRASPNQQSSPGLSRGRVEPRISALAASKRAEREREQAVNRQRRSGPDTTELPPELPNPEMIGAHAGRGNAVRPGRITRRHTLNPLPPPLPKPVGKPKMLGANPARGNAVHPGPIRRTKGESLEAVVSNMNKIYEEAVAALDGAEALSTGDAGQGQPGMLDLLKEIRDLLQQVVGGDGGVPAGEDDGFKLPDNASEVDLTTGEPEDEPEALDELPLPTDGKDLTNNDGRVDLGAEDREGAEGDDDDEDRR